MADLVTLEDVVNTQLRDLDDESRRALVNTLQQREDLMADMMREVAMRFGMYPEIVAEALAEIGVGTPIEQTQRDYIRTQFTALMERLQEEYRRNHPGDPTG
jgi:hypothetical protein